MLLKLYEIRKYNTLKWGVLRLEHMITFIQLVSNEEDYFSPSFIMGKINFGINRDY